MEPSSPFLKILPYEVARGWVEGLVGGPSKVFARLCGMGPPGERGRQKIIIIICLFALVLFSSFYHKLRLVEQDIERI